MSRGISNKLYRNFTKGLITEASMLTYPENACIDLDNCILYRKGNLSRRLGVDYEPGHQYSPFQIGPAELSAHAVKTFSWEAVANDTNINFLVVQVGVTLRFYDMSAFPLSAGLEAFTVNLLAYVAPNTTIADAELCEVSFDSGKGYLFVVGEKFEPFLVEYNKAIDDIVTKRIYIQMRDFQGINDNLANDEEPTTLTPQHNYNLLNQGWVTPQNAATGPKVTYFNSFGDIGTQLSPGQTPISDFFTATARYPGNNKQWWVAKNATTGVFDPSLLATVYSGAGKAPRGHFVLNAFYKDRSAASGIAGLPVEVVDQRPTSVAFFAGRVWYVCQSTLYYSQILDDKAKAGACYQEADPTAEDIPDLIASDGGVLPVPGMGKGLRLLPSAGGILVFANNGIWFVSGAGGGFSALDISTQKVDSLGTNAPNSVVDSKDAIFWFSRTGIQAMKVQTGAGGTSFEQITLSQDTIQSFYVDSIPEAAVPYVKGIYDPATNVVQWLFNSVDSDYYLYDRVLNLDLSLNAFFPWSINSTGPRLTAPFLTPVLNKISDPFNTSIKDSFIKYMTIAPVDSGYWRYNFAFFRDYTFADWRSSNGIGYDYLSFIESGYELLDDAMRKKEMNYVFVYLRRTEENFVPAVDDWLPDNPSSCLFQTKWDWSNNQISNKWTNKVEVYRHNRLPTFDESDPVFNTGFPIVVSKSKVRGHGRAIQFRFESNGIGRDFDLLGWAVPYSGNTSP